MIRHDQLAAYIEAARPRPFVWGEWDCCQFASQWVLSQTGTDFRLQFPPYENEEEAKAVLEFSGGLIALVDSVLEPIHRSRAMKGDLVLGPQEGGAALGICLGQNSAHVGPNGLVFFPTSTALKAWRVP